MIIFGYVFGKEETIRNLYEQKQNKYIDKLQKTINSLRVAKTEIKYSRDNWKNKYNKIAKN